MSTSTAGLDAPSRPCEKCRVRSTILRAFTTAMIGGVITASFSQISLRAETAARPAPRPFALAAGAISTPPPAHAQAGQRTPAKPQPRQKPAAAARPSLEIEVTDSAGATLDGVAIRLTGPVEREGRTDAAGVLGLTNLRAGTYRLRFEGEGYVAFEREVTLPAATRVVRVDVALTAVPETPRPDPVPDAPAESPSPPPGASRVLDVTTFIERNFIGRGEPQRISTLGCTGHATTRLMQVRDPLEDIVYEDADATLYTLAGEGAAVIDGRTHTLNPGTLAVVPRGARYSLSRRGRNPLVVLSVLSGPPCAEGLP
jgi:mannose-6-phosphate isomerase-like protein (cupin superfamily)